MTAVLAVDLGKTGCRAVLWTGPDGPDHLVREVPGAPGLAESDGVTAAVAAVTSAAELVNELASELPSGRLDAVCVGAAAPPPPTRPRPAPWPNCCWTRC
ncbi:hypothetical protein [Streptomyces sp. LN704]|uniref:hypothetical protein n=1 Tax=Streptomyces sp. LN704 TaxID=3112982 RepID=UPI00372449B1